MTEQNNDTHHDKQETAANDPTPPTPEGDAKDQPTPPMPPPLGVFDPQRLHREMAIDTALRWLIAAAIVGMLWWLVIADSMQNFLPLLGLAAATVGWVMLGHANAKVLRGATEMLGLIEFRPDAAEVVLSNMLKRRALPRWLRLMLYHRFGMIRHRQQRFSEAAAIAQTVLQQPSVGPTRKIRGHLLLMLIESRLEEREAWGAYAGLAELSRLQLSLPEALQRMALRTRYELMVGQHHEALRQARDKVRLSELMPGPQCGAFHAMLAIAAQSTGQEEWQRWLWRRVELLCSEEQIKQLRQAATAPPAVDA